MDKEQYKRERIEIEIARISRSWEKIGEWPSKEKLREMAEWSIKFDDEQLRKRRRIWRTQIEKANDFFGYPSNKADLEQLQVNIAKKGTEIKDELDSDEEWWSGTIGINKTDGLFYYPVLLGIPIIFLGCYFEEKRAGYALSSIMDIEDYSQITESVIDEVLAKTNEMYERWEAKTSKD